MFFPPRYIIRVLKSILYVVLIVVLILLFIYTLSEKKPDLNFTDMITKPLHLFIFFILYGIVYPLVSFVRKDVMLEKSYAEIKISILDVFEKTGYKLESEDENILKFRISNSLSRITRLLGEDMVSVEYVSGTNCVSLSGYRKDVYRLARHIEFANRQVE